eukprot:COSAG02_NODE_1323_length_13255_cov_2.890696_7_plen_126_part_00
MIGLPSPVCLVSVFVAPVRTLTSRLMEVEVSSGSSRGELHLHHWWLAWLPSLLFTFNHPISAIPLGVSLGMFAQGCAAYNYAPLVYDDSCEHLSYVNHTRGQLFCIVEGPADFDICTRHGQVLCF